MFGQQPSARNNQHLQTKHVLFEHEKDSQKQPLPYLILGTKNIHVLP
jgi:hypothetical protein